MFPSSNPASINGSLLWTFPGCSLRILFSLRALERLRAQIGPSSPGSEAQGRARQLGGLLIGSQKTQSGVTNVVDFVPLLAPPDPESSKFSFPPGWFEEVSDRCPAGFKVVGYYRTSPDGLIRLEPEDLKLIQQRFADPASAFLVIAPGRPASAGFFCWQDGTVPINSSLIFPVSADKLTSGDWPIRNKGPLGEQLERARIPRSLTATVISAALVIALLVISGVLLKRSTAAQSPVAGLSRVAFHVDRTGERFVINWAPSAQPIVTASSGSLEIREGTKPLALISLTPEQLQAGNLSYDAYPNYTDQAEFRLRVIGSAGSSPLEFVAYPGRDRGAPAANSAPVTVRAPSIVAPEPSPIGQRASATRDSREIGSGDYLQVMAASRADAERVVEALEKRGFHAVMAPAPKKNMFRVLVGPLADSGTEEQTRSKLEAAGFKNPIARKY